MWVHRAFAAALGVCVAFGAMAQPADPTIVGPEWPMRDGQFVLVGSSYNEMMSSYNRMLGRLRGEEQEAFLNAIEQLKSDAERLAFGVQSEPAYQEFQYQLLLPFEGMTAREIVEMLERPTWLETREARERLPRAMGALVQQIQYLGQARGNSTPFPSSSRIPGRLAPDLELAGNDDLRLFHGVDVFVSPVHPRAVEWQRRLEAHQGFDAELFESAMAESYYYLSHLAHEYDGGRTFLRTYRQRFLERERPGVVFLPAEPIVLDAERHEYLSPHSPMSVHGPILIERPRVIGEPIVVVHGDRDQSFEVRFGTFPNTREFLEGLERLKDLDIDGQDPLEILVDTFRRYAIENQHALPPQSKTAGRIFFDAEQIFPAFHSHADIVVARDRPDREALLAKLREAPLTPEGYVESSSIEKVGAENYYYLLHLGRTQPEGTAIVASIRQALEQGDTRRWRHWQEPAHGQGYELVHGPRDGRWDPSVLSSAGLPSTSRAGHLPIFSNPDLMPRALYALGNALEHRRNLPAREAQPLLMERPHAPGVPVRVAYADGVIEEVAHGLFPNTRSFIASLEALRGMMINDHETLVALRAALYQYTRDPAQQMTFPPHSATHGRIFVDVATLYPAHLDDASVLINPAHPEGRPARAELDGAPRDSEGRVDPALAEALGAKTYFYTHGFGANEEEALEAVEEYRMAGDDWEAESNRWRKPPKRHAFAFRPGVAPDALAEARGERVHFTPFSDINPVSMPDPATTPVLMQRPSSPGASVLVLYADSQIREIQHGTFPNTDAFLEGLASLEKTEAELEQI